MYTSLLLFALTTYSAQPALIPAAPQWLDDYSVALQHGRTEKKPLAVFVGSGAEGWARLSNEGRFTKEIDQLLQARYVRVYLDTNKELGRQLAAAFDLGDRRGLIISDASGSKQAFHFEGKLSNDELQRALKKYADSDRVVERTETSVKEPALRINPPLRINPAPAGRSC
jgi:hypothetical protein